MVIKAENLVKGAAIMYNFTRPQSPPTSGSGVWVISDETMQYVYTIDMAIVCFLLSLFGIGANVINMVVFVRMGFTETINISLFGLAVSDTGVLIGLLWCSICYNPFFMYSDLPVDTVALQHYPGSWTHTIFNRITGFITVFIALERCLCIAFPLKVKQIMTRPRVTGVIVGIYVVTMATMIPSYFSSYIDWTWDSGRNRTILTMVMNGNMDTLNVVTWYVCLIYPFITFSSVVVCTGIFVWKLNHRGKWLQSATGKQDQAAAVRDQQIIKMVVAVATIFIVCYIPSIFTFLAMIVVPEIYMGQKYENMFMFLCAICYPLAAFNSSANMFIYYKMMSKYKVVLKSLCQRDKTGG